MATLNGFRTALVVLALSAGCSTAGPFVTNISLARPGVLTIEKCMVEYSSFGDSVSNKNCTVQQLDIGSIQTDPSPRPWHEPQLSESESRPAKRMSPAVEQRVLARLVPEEREWYCDSDECYLSMDACVRWAAGGTGLRPQASCYKVPAKPSASAEEPPSTKIDL